MLCSSLLIEILPCNWDLSLIKSNLLIEFLSMKSFCKVDTKEVAYFDEFSRKKALFFAKIKKTKKTRKSSVL